MKANGYTGSQKCVKESDTYKWLQKFLATVRSKSSSMLSLGVNKVGPDNPECSPLTNYSRRVCIVAGLKGLFYVEDRFGIDNQSREIEQFKFSCTVLERASNIMYWWPNLSSTYG